MWRRIYAFGLILALAASFFSCGTNSFYRSKSKRIKKVRSGNKITQLEKEEKNETVVAIWEEPESEEIYSEPIDENITIDAVEVEEKTDIVEVQNEEKSGIKNRIQSAKTTISRKFKDNHYGTLALFLTGLVSGSVGYIYWSPIPYVLAFLLFAAAFTLALLMKYYIAPKEGDKESKKYKNKIWFANFVFYSTMMVIVLSLIAFLVILI